MSVIFQTLLQQADASGSRSTIMKSLTWALALLLTAILTCLSINPNHWIVVYLVIALSLVFALFLFTFIYCMFKNPDALRSEKYSIQKMAIERGLVGDSTRPKLSEIDNNDTLIEEGGK